MQLQLQNFVRRWKMPFCHRSMVVYKLKCTLYDVLCWQESMPFEEVLSLVETTPSLVEWIMRLIQVDDTPSTLPSIEECDQQL